ncbi:MAG: hypothetical protein AAGD28_09905 [Bacteroidota bacterium]
MINKEEELTKAREARAAIEKLYIEMRHLANRGWYKQLGASGEVLTDALLTLSPEIYGDMGDPNKVELEGLVYVIDRLPKGIEECRYIKLISEEGFSTTGFEVIVPSKRRRNCYRVDKEQMFIEITRGRSEIYDILTHLTFMYVEAEKIKRNARDDDGTFTLEWKKLGKIVKGETNIDAKNEELALIYLSTLLGRSFNETRAAYEKLQPKSGMNSRLFHVVYWLGYVAMEDEDKNKSRMVSFSPTLRERIGHHIYGERWANQIKGFLHKKKLLDRPLHIISANLHSVLNSLYAFPALRKSLSAKHSIEELALELSKPEQAAMMARVKKYALAHGMYELDDPFGTNITVQIFDTAKLDLDKLSPELRLDHETLKADKPIILVMDYAFGEQAYETMDELLKPYDIGEESIAMSVESISIMGKAGILTGGKGDIMIPNAHVFEGTADNYPFDNDLRCEDFSAEETHVCEGPMITVLGTSLQNKDVLSYFKKSSWQAIGLEMEGAHYQKAIQAAAWIRKNISKEVVLRYAYYASDNPLETGSTLASGSLGAVGVRPTYLITRKILDKILGPSASIKLGLVQPEKVL